MPPVVCPNDELLATLSERRTRFQVASMLHLFVNDFEPTPTAVLSDFIDAFFPGYLPQPLAGTWSVPVIESEGVAEMRSGPASFRGLGPGFDQPCHGWFVEDGVRVLCCERFHSTVILGPTRPELVFRVVVRQISLSILEP